MLPTALAWLGDGVRNVSDWRRIVVVLEKRRLKQSERCLLSPARVRVSSEPLIDSSSDAGVSPASPPMHVRNLAFTLVSVAIVVLLLQYMQSVLLPLVLAGLLFYALDRPVDWLQKRRVPRAIGAAVMLFVVIAGCGVLAYTLQGQAMTVIDELPAGRKRRRTSSGRRNWIHGTSW